MNLYELTEAYTDLVAMLEDASSEEEAAAIMAEIDGISADIAAKGEAYARIMRNMMAEAAAAETEIKRLQAIKKARDNAIERLKNNIIFAMGIAGASEIRTSIGKWKICKNPPHVDITDEAKVPEEFTVEQPRKIMKTMIIQHFKETGEIPEGCEIIESEGVRFR